MQLSLSVTSSPVGADVHRGDAQQFAATLLHDFNNFLAPALMVMFELQEQELVSPRQQRRLAAAIGCVNRALALARDLVDMPECLEPHPVRVSIADILQDLTDVMACAFGSATTITLDVAEDLPPVFVDPRLLERAILNLAFNSNEAMPGGGRLTLVAKRDRAVLLDGASSLRIAVSDEGTGMAEETIRSAARPGFSTKPHGAGLGLPMVRGFVEGHGGCMSVISVKGIGTTVTLWLPTDRSELKVLAPANRRAQATVEDHIISPDEMGADRGPPVPGASLEGL